MLKPHFQYLSYVLRHKWYVYRAGRALGVGRWQLLIHDMSKFLPVEWFPYVERFYGKHRYQAEPEAKGYFHKPGDSDAYDRAWEHHWKNNPHHWQYWTDENLIVHRLIACTDEPLAKCLPMPKKYMKEMVADWIGAGQAQGKPDVAGWYKENQYKMTLHEDTRADVVYWLGVAGRQGIIPRGWAS